MLYNSNEDLLHYITVVKLSFFQDMCDFEITQRLAHSCKPFLQQKQTDVTDRRVLQLLLYHVKCIFSFCLCTCNVHPLFRMHFRPVGHITSTRFTLCSWRHSFLLYCSHLLFPDCLSALFPNSWSPFSNPNKEHTLLSVLLEAYCCTFFSLASTAPSIEEPLFPFSAGDSFRVSALWKLHDFCGFIVYTPWQRLCVMWST